MCDYCNDKTKEHTDGPKQRQLIIGKQQWHDIEKKQHKQIEENNKQ